MLLANSTDSRLEVRLREMNEALLLSSLHQHEQTERAEKATALALESEDRYRTLFEVGPMAVFSCDASGGIQKYNRFAAECWGREPNLGESGDNYCGSFKLFLPNGDSLPHDLRPIAEVLRGEIPEVRDVEAVIERPDGTRITIVVNIRPIVNASGAITGAINCAYDITDRKRAESALREQSEALADLHRRKDEFLAMLSHELRNPLAPISNAVHLLRLRKNEDPLQLQARVTIERQLAQMTRLIDDLMEVSRITTGRVHLRPDRVAVAGIVERAVETASPLIDQKRHDLAVSVPAEPIWLYADAGRLEQVVVNLLTNAAKYTGENGRIWLALEREGDEAVIRIRDTGVGIAPGLLPRVFDLFTQAERTLDRSQGGLGIGLALVQRLVEMHRGTVEVTSVLGHGSEFVVRLPVLLAPAPVIPVTSIAPPVASEGLLRILVVDDNVDSADSLAMLLQACGHNVRTAYDGKSGLGVALEYRPEVMLLDIGLPGMDGYEVAKRLRLLPELPDLVLIAMTGYGLDSDRNRSKEAGFDHHLVKPADFDALLRILDGVSKRVNRL